MEQKDLEQIKKLFQEEFKVGFKGSFTEVWEGNLEPAFTDIQEDITNIQSDVTKLKTDVTQLQASVAQLPTKSYLDDKLANLEGDLIKKLRKEDEKVNRLAEILKNKNILTDQDITELGNLQVFPKSL